MNCEARYIISMDVHSELFDHLEATASILRDAMTVENKLDDYGREAVLGHALSHVLMALAKLPPTIDAIPF